MPRHKDGGFCYKPPEPSTDMTAEDFIGHCYCVRANLGRWDEAKFARAFYGQVFGCPPDSTLKVMLVELRVYYKLFVDRKGIENLSPVIADRAAAVLKMDPNYDSLTIDIGATVKLLDQCYSDGSETEARKGKEIMEKESKAESKAETGGTSQDSKESGRGGHNRVKWFGFPATDVCRWFGAMGYKTKDCIEAAKKMGIDINESTIRNQVPAGKRGDRGQPAQLTRDQRHEVDLVLGRTVSPKPGPAAVKGKTISDPIPPKEKPKGKPQVKPKAPKKEVKGKTKPPVKKASKPKGKAPKGKKK